MNHPKFNLWVLHAPTTPPPLTPPPLTGEGRNNEKGGVWVQSTPHTPFFGITPPSRWEGAEDLIAAKQRSETGGIGKDTNTPNIKFGMCHISEKSSWGLRCE